MEDLKQTNDGNIKITDTARDFFIRFANSQGKTFFTVEKDKELCYIRMKVKAGGCSGRLLSMELENVSNDRNPLENTILISNGISIIVDSKSRPLMDGLVVDYNNDLMDSGIKFTFTNAEHTCGCGKSWA